MIYREPIEWLDTWVEGADTSLLPRVLLVGDSIARSYYQPARDQLAASFACARYATSRSVCDPAFNAGLQRFLDEYEFSVIHFNNGLHGWDYDEEAYRAGLQSTLQSLTAAFPSVRLIVANSTPVWTKESPRTLHARTERVRARNRIAAELADRFDLELSDLFTVAIDHPEYIRPDGVHFLESGQQVLGKQAASIIAKNPDR